MKKLLLVFILLFISLPYMAYAIHKHDSFHNFTILSKYYLKNKSKFITLTVEIPDRSIYTLHIKKDTKNTKSWNSIEIHDGFYIDMIRQLKTKYLYNTIYSISYNRTSLTNVDIIKVTLYTNRSQRCYFTGRDDEYLSISSKARYRHCSYTKGGLVNEYFLWTAEHKLFPIHFEYKKD